MVLWWGRSCDGDGAIREIQTLDLLIPTKLMKLISDLISKYIYHVQIFCNRQPLFSFFYFLTHPLSSLSYFSV